MSCISRFKEKSKYILEYLINTGTTPDDKWKETETEKQFPERKYRERSCFILILIFFLEYLLIDLMMIKTCLTFYHSKNITHFDA